MAMLTLHPKLVDTARGLSPRAENSLEKLVVRLIRGRSSATTTHVRTQLKLTPRVFSWFTDDPKPFVHSSMTPEKQSIMSTVTFYPSNKIDMAYHMSKMCP